MRRPICDAAEGGVAEQIDIVRAAVAADGQIVPLIETAQGVSNLENVASAAGVQRLAFGTLDYGVDLDLSGDERGLIYPAAQIAHLAAPGWLRPSPASRPASTTTSV